MIEILDVSMLGQVRSMHATSEVKSDLVGIQSKQRQIEGAALGLSNAKRTQHIAEEVACR